RLFSQRLSFPTRRSSDLAAGDALGHPVLNSAVVAVFERADPPKAAPISFTIPPEPRLAGDGYYESIIASPGEGNWKVSINYSTRSEEHTSELQSPDHIVC